MCGLGSRKGGNTRSRDDFGEGLGMRSVGAVFAGGAVGEGE